MYTTSSHAERHQVAHAIIDFASQQPEFFYINTKTAMLLNCCPPIPCGATGLIKTGHITQTWLTFDAYNEPINNWIIIDVFMMGNIDE